MFLSLVRAFICIHARNTLYLEMPKYAVAVGKCPGIYDTWAECQQQVSGYSGPKYKKFDSENEALEYLKKFSQPSTSNGHVSRSVSKQTSFGSFRIENSHPPQLIEAGKSTTNNLFLSGIVQQITQLQEQFNQFKSSVTTTLEDVNVRLVNLEKSCFDGNDDVVRPAKRIKLEDAELFEIDHTTFLRNSQDIVMVYTDGACTNNGKKGAKAGIGVWFNHGHKLNVSAPLIGPATNNNAEIQAARVAITQAAKAGLRKLCVHTDSQFTINCITEWINKWKKNQWKLVNGDDVKNKVELVKLDQAIQQLEQVEWIYVRGHRGVEGNEMADKLAREGAALYKTNVTYSDYSDL